ncbi:phosphoribosyltransferase [Adhaeribacter sp. BT258]|uniref:Phosphoribosyltransferase n=1 Tax=Adhaeribacter terrigena TaxID=2793070 RepID=A0ABS1BWK2_9BACT|nr:phosphoribosyltransferase family protein [Adhaeribacter terrigena]MBK0401517.1 phosphoribosyltransferase [Adhaeribacter terrigena]
METTFSAQTRILDADQIRQKITRIAFEIYEHNFEEKELVLVGIAPKGYVFAELLHQELQKISPFEISLHRLQLNKQAPSRQSLNLTPELGNLQNKVVILADDVLNTGRTLAYSLPLFLDAQARKIEIATLIDRHHTLFPVSATYTGYSLATTLNEHIEVTFPENGNFAAYLV